MSNWVENKNSEDKKTNKYNGSVQSSSSGVTAGEVIGTIFIVIGIIALVAITVGLALIWVCTGICSTADSLNSRW